jgi:hypothetical protein
MASAIPFLCHRHEQASYPKPHPGKLNGIQRDNGGMPLLPLGVFDLEKRCRRAIADDRWLAWFALNGAGKAPLDNLLVQEKRHGLR